MGRAFQQKSWAILPSQRRRRAKCRIYKWLVFKPIFHWQNVVRSARSKMQQSSAAFCKMHIRVLRQKEPESVSLVPHRSALYQAPDTQLKNGCDQCLTMQHRGVEITYMHDIFNRVISKVIGRSVGHATTNPTTCQHGTKTLDVVIATDTFAFPCPIGVRPNSPPITTRVSSKRPRRSRSVRSAAAA